MHPWQATKELVAFRAVKQSSSWPHKSSRSYCSGVQHPKVVVQLQQRNVTHLSNILPDSVFFYLN